MTRLWHAVLFEPPEPAPLVSSGTANAEQDAVIACECSPCAVHAGPGAGKTRTLVQKTAVIARRMERELGDSARGSVLVLTFTKPGKAVLRRRLSQLGIPAGVVSVRGTQEVCWEAYRGSHPGQKRLGTGLQRQLLATSIAEAGGDIPTNLESVVRRAASAINELAELSSDVSEVLTGAVLAAYAAKKLAIGRYDDGDVRRWIVDHAADIVAGWVRQGVRVVLLDEAQDSSPAEAALFWALHAAGLMVCYVGDLRQVLYEFRGARPELLVEALCGAPGFHVHLLRSNRRSKAMPVGELNRFAAWAFEGLEAETMGALEVGGEPFRSVLGPEQSAVLEVLPQALSAVEGLPRDTSTSRPRPDKALARAIGLPERLERGQSLFLEVANRDDADQLERVLVDWGYLPVMLVRQSEAPALLEVLCALVDPEGRLGGPARWYGAASPLCLVLNALRYQPHLAMKMGSEGARALDYILRSLRYRQATRSFDELLDQARIALNECPSTAGSVRLTRYIEHAVRLLDEWEGIRRAERMGHLAGKDLLRRLFSLAEQSAGDRSGHLDSDHPLISWLETHCTHRDDAARRIEEWLERPSLGRTDSGHAPGADEPPVLYIAVVNQVKGDEADYAVIVALDSGRFPFRGIDTHGERCRWWVAISRARLGTAYLGVAGNSSYWPPRRESEPG